MLTAYIVYYIIEVIGNLIHVIMIISALFAAGVVTAYFCEKCSPFIESEWAKNFVEYWYKKTLVVFFISCSLLIVFPDQKQVVMFYTAYQLDQQNIKVKDSKLNPQEMLNIIDKSIKRVDELLTNYTNKKGEK